MNLNINVHETVSGDIFVKELAYEEEAYATSSASQFTDETVLYNQSISLTALEKITTTTKEILVGYSNDHATKEVSSKFKISDDGWYRVFHLVIPTSQWLEEAAEAEVLENYSSIYIADGTKLYKKESDTDTFNEIELEDMLGDESLASSNVWMIEKDVFVIFNLWQCYLNYCKKMLEGECSQENKCSDCNNDLTRNRNLLWIFLNAIQYLIKFGEFYKAQELLENISGGCNTLCSNEMFSKQYNCGCSK